MEIIACERQYGNEKLMMYNSLYNNELVLNCEKADLTIK